MEVTAEVQHLGNFCSCTPTPLNNTTLEPHWGESSTVAQHLEVQAEVHAWEWQLGQYLGMLGVE